MKKIALLLVLCLTVFISTQAQNVEVHNYKFYAQYNAQGNKMSSNSTGLLVTISHLTDIYGRTTVILTGTESITIAGIPTPGAPLCPINDRFYYTVVDNGWRVFCWGNTKRVLISSDTSIARVEYYGLNGNLSYYTEYRK